MYKIDKILVIPGNPFRKESVDLKILQAVEKLVPFTVSHVDYKELAPQGSKRRFHLKSAMGMRDK